MGRFSRRITQEVPVPDGLDLRMEHNISAVTIARLSYGQEADLELERYAAFRAKFGDEFLMSAAKNPPSPKDAPDDAPDESYPIEVAIEANGPLHSLLRKCIIAFDGEPVLQTELSGMEEIITKKDAHWLAEQILRASGKLLEPDSENGDGSDSTPT